MAESVNALYKTELHRNPAALAANGGHWKGLDDLEIATCGWVGWFNEDRLHSELDDATPAEFEEAHYRRLAQANAARETQPTEHPSNPVRITKDHVLLHVEVAMEPAPSNGASKTRVQNNPVGGHTSQH